MNDRSKELDGLRGIAILLVIAHHVLKRADYFTANGFLHFITRLSLVGWMGVDIFFVLSGFLITSILLKAKDEKNYYKNFYARRVLRIFPLYYAALALFLIAVKFVPAVAKTADTTIPYLPTFLLYQQNWLYLFSIYPSAYLSVTWSLAIEEQFYLIWPAIVRMTNQKLLTWISAGIVILSLLVRTVATLLSPDSEQLPVIFFYNTFTRLEGLALGALTAIFFITPTNWQATVKRLALPASIVTMILFLYLAFIASPAGPHPLYRNIPLGTIGYTLLAFSSAAMIIFLTSGAEASLIRKIFANGGLVFFGKYSYSMYLFHMPVALTLLDIMVKAKVRGWEYYVAYSALTVVITSLLALLTWNILENPLLKLKRHFTNESETHEATQIAKQRST
ncbi:acyltransferase [Candidatus Villigracilis affinis]|jgi:peptidoglycan/LPS O-acetylase OafA/YrhL|uniref:acyltransferase family protein n=1 Tax=Candidatus Villigracilis affinis TaxID=3140682 RepID=UPI001DAB1036|nr:acyltransferase [Anaerolineales bacterium]MBL0345897.1 acyltransferase [Anaerolineales bacterium]